MSLSSLTQLCPNEIRLLMDTTKIFAARQQSGAPTHKSHCCQTYGVDTSIKGVTLEGMGVRAVAQVS